MKTLSDLYKEYEIRHGGNPKHNFSHFIKVVSMVDNHRTYIRPMIRWWEELKIIKK